MTNFELEENNRRFREIAERNRTRLLAMDEQERAPDGKFGSGGGSGGGKKSDGKKPAEAKKELVSKSDHVADLKERIAHHDEQRKKHVDGDKAAGHMGSMHHGFGIGLHGEAKTRATNALKALEDDKSATMTPYLAKMHKWAASKSNEANKHSKGKDKGPMGPAMGKL